MIRIPINRTTFKKTFLKGDGHLEIDSAKWKTLFDARANFTRDTDRFADVAVSRAAHEEFRLGRDDSVQLGLGFRAEAGSAIHLIWPPAHDDDPQDPAIEENLLNPLSAGTLVVHLELHGRGYGNSASKLPAGPVSFQIHAEAGGGVRLDRFKVYDETQSVRVIIGDLLGTLILPHQVDDVGKIPRPGEVLVFGYDGYLRLRAGMNWGYSISGSKKLDFKNLTPEFKYSMKIAASMSVGYRLAGSFEIEARRGRSNDDGETRWIGFVVRKSRQSRFTFAADIGLTARYTLTGLPATADQFLIALMGGNAERVVDGLEKASKYTTIKKLEARITDKFKRALIDDLAMEWVDRVLDNTNIADVLPRVENAVHAYNDLDDRVIQLYEGIVEQVGEETGSIKNVATEIAGLTNPGALQSLISKAADSGIEEQAWGLIQRFWGDRIYDILLVPEEIREVAAIGQKVLDFLDHDNSADVRTLIQKLKAASGLDPLFKTLREWDTPRQLRDGADRRIKALVERLLGKAFEELKTRDLGRRLQKLHDAIDAVQEFKKNGYRELLEKAGEESFKAELAYSYSRVRTNTALIDIEINLEHPQGAELARLASHGQFAELLERYDTGVVRVHSAMLTHKLQTTSQFRFHLLGRGMSRLVEIVSETEHAIQSHQRGLLHVYTTSAAIRQQRSRGRKESMETTTSNFLFRAIAQKLQESGDPSAVDPDTKQVLADTLRDMAVQYDLTIEDPKTTDKELREYLNFAELTGLIPNREEYAETLRNEFPAGFGKVSARYVVRYDSDAVMFAFALEDTDQNKQLTETARKILRSFIGSNYVAMRKKLWEPWVGLAYLSGLFADFREDPKFLDRAYTLKLPQWFTAGEISPEKTLRKVQLNVLAALYNTERNYLDDFVALDKIVGKLTSQDHSVAMDELEKRARKFVANAHKLDRFQDNAFFAVFDAMIRMNSGRTQGGRSALILEITPPVRKRQKAVTVTKYLMSGHKGGVG